jgi:hypothetical protein
MAIGPQTVDATSWHDDLVHAALVNAGDALKGDWWSGLVRDIDHIVESICAGPTETPGSAPRPPH